MPAKITKDMILGEVVSKYPEAAEAMLRRGLHCIGCSIAAFETIEQGASAHGMSEKELDKMVKEINDIVNAKKKAKVNKAKTKVKRRK